MSFVRVSFESRVVWFLSLFLLGLVQPQGQVTYNSGSTGADGAFNPQSGGEIQIPESGVFNFTTVNIPANIGITFKRNSRNTPVTILASGDVTINGAISVRGQNTTSQVFPGLGGPGGFDGGRGVASPLPNNKAVNGSGPGGGGGGEVLSNSGQNGGGGGGYATPGNNGDGSAARAGGQVYGSFALVPLLGGSGGGGGVNSAGAGGGGAILIASSGTISGGGTISAEGGFTGVNNSFNGGSGSGGAIRLVASAISGSLILNVSGGTAYIAGTNGRGGAGYIRIEAYDLNGFAPQITPANAGFSTTTPKPAIPINAQQLRIVSVAGVNAPANPSGSFVGPDIILPATQSNPVTVTLAATNLPLTTNVQVVVVPENAAATTVQASALTGTLASSTASASVTLPSSSCLIYATATVDLTQISELKLPLIEGEKVLKMEIATSLGGQSEITYITESGKRIKKLSE